MDADELYGLPLDRFVSERGALARTLRADGRREEAAQVASLRKPSVAAWAVNQLVRTQRRAATDLFDAGDGLRQAQADLLDGGRDRGALRAAGQRERAAVEALVTIARGLLTSDGHELSAVVIERVADTLHAAALDDDAREKVRDGRLERELRHVGLGVGSAAGATPPRRAASKDTDARRAGRERAKDRTAESAARRVADRAARALQAAEKRRERAEQALRDAEKALATAREEVEAAAGAHRRALDRLERP